MKDRKELEEEASKILHSLLLTATEKRLVGLMWPFLQVLFSGVPESSQTKVLKVFYDYQLVKEKLIEDSTKGKGQGNDK